MGERVIVPLCILLETPKLMGLSPALCAAQFMDRARGVRCTLVAACCQLSERSPSNVRLGICFCNCVRTFRKAPQFSPSLHLVSVPCKTSSAVGIVRVLPSPTIGNLYPRFRGRRCKVAATGKMTPSGQNGAKTFPPCANLANLSARLGQRDATHPGSTHSPCSHRRLRVENRRIAQHMLREPVRSRYNHSFVGIMEEIDVMSVLLLSSGAGRVTVYK